MGVRPAYEWQLGRKIDAQVGVENMLYARTNIHVIARLQQRCLYWHGFAAVLCNNSCFVRSPNEFCVKVPVALLVIFVPVQKKQVSERKVVFKGPAVLYLCWNIGTAGKRSSEAPEGISGDQSPSVAFIVFHEIGLRFIMCYLDVRSFCINSHAKMLVLSVECEKTVLGKEVNAIEQIR